MKFGDKIRYIREKLSLSQQELAKELNVSFCTVNRWENSHSLPSTLAQKTIDDFCEQRELIFQDKETMRFNVIDLFCGCGGLSLGFEQAGFNIVGGVDINQAAINTFNRNFPHARGVCCDCHY